MNALSFAVPYAVTVETIASLPVWVAWQNENREDGKPTKVPYAPDGGKACADDQATWGTRKQAEARAARLAKPCGVGGIGIELGPLDQHRSCGGIDLDTCRDPATGAIADWAQDVIHLFATYTEISPSGTGVKLFFTYSTADLDTLRPAMGAAKFGKQFKRSGGDHPPAIELYLGNRYFAVTGQILDGSPTEFRFVETDLLLQLIKVTGPAFAQAQTGEQRKQASSSDRSRSAVAFRKGSELRRTGASYDEMVAGLNADPETTAWTRQKGEANEQRELRRIWEKAAPNGPLIRVIAGELHTAATLGETAILDSGLPIYQRGDALVRPISREVTASRGRTTIAAGLGEIGVHGLIDVMCGCARWERYDARVEDWLRINPPTNVAQVILARHGQWRLPPIAGVITTPTLRPDRSVLSQPGYDPATRLYYVADSSLRLHPAVHQPTRAAAESALKALEGLLAEFPFTSEVGKAVALSAFITPVVRGALTVAPLHLFRANTAGSGKSYLADITSAISTGRPCPVISAAPDEAETEKRLAGLLLAGYSLISIDNINGELGGDLLCQAIERPLIRLRRLGASDITEIESVATILATGNNARVRGDMVRRTIIADLDAKEERPELRKFTGDPVATVLADRGRYVSAALVIVRAYLLAGAPDQPSPLASFADWSTLVRGALMWLGCADPVITMETAREDDPELTELREVLGEWEACFGGEAVAVRDVAIAVDARQPTQIGEPTDYSHPALRETLLRTFGERGTVNCRRLGKWLAANEGRIVAGRRFKRAGTTTRDGTVRWRIEDVRHG